MPPGHWAEERALACPRGNQGVPSRPLATEPRGPWKLSLVLTLSLGTTSSLGLGGPGPQSTRSCAHRSGRAFPPGTQPWLPPSASSWIAVSSLCPSGHSSRWSVDSRTVFSGLLLMAYCAQSPGLCWSLNST